MGEVTDTTTGSGTHVSPETRALAEEIGRLYPAVYQRFHAPRQPLAGLDVTPRMLDVLRHLLAGGPLTMGELVAHLHLGKSTTTELVGRLMAKGLVDRMRDERDQRRVFIWLTATGKARTLAAMAQTRPLQDDLLTQAVARMPPEDRQRLIEGLRALLEAEQEIPR
ncbi:MAG: MarR family winged helix-turn-helix transcriptional regulator [Ktedonobacterales bacterium]